MESNHWNKFKLRVPICCNIETIYKPWSTTEGLENWFLWKAAFTKKDGIKLDRIATV
jgi:hypothetical protein